MNKPLRFDENTKLNIGDYFRAYKSKYYVLIKDIVENQRNFESEYGEYKTTFVKVDIFNKEEKLLAENSIVPIDKIISGALAKYIPNLNYDPTYLGSINPYNYPVQFKIWRDMVEKCFDCKCSTFPYIGALGTTVCDRWRCFEYFLADFKHIEGYAEAKEAIFYKNYIVDLYDIQKHIHPSNRVYAPGYVKLKPFKQSDICKYINLPPNINNYPKDLETTMKYRSKEIDIKKTLFAKQTGLNVVLDLDTASYYYDNNVGYIPLVSNSFNRVYICNYIFNHNTVMKEMCTIVRKDDKNV